MPTDRPIRAVLFDKDGTLVDLRASWLPAYHAMATALAAAAGHPPAFALELLRRQGHDPGSGDFAPDSPLLWATNETLARAWSAEPELAGVVDVGSIVEAHLADSERFPPVPVGDLAGLFARLRGRGLKLGIATMDTERQAHATARRFGLEAHLCFVAGCDSGHGHKPDPGMVAAFCAAARVLPAEVVMVGDTPADLMMGRAAGCGLTVGVLTGGLGRSALEPHADIVLDTIHALETLQLLHDAP
jgi:phosphoglycolate phosphatase